MTPKQSFLQYLKSSDLQEFFWPNSRLYHAPSFVSNRTTHFFPIFQTFFTVFHQPVTLCKYLLFNHSILFMMLTENRVYVCVLHHRGEKNDTKPTDILTLSQQGFLRSRNRGAQCAALGKPVTFYGINSSKVFVKGCPKMSLSIWSWHNFGFHGNRC